MLQSDLWTGDDSAQAKSRRDEMPMGSYVRIRREPSPSESFRTHLPHSNVCVLRNALTGPVSQQRNLLPNCNVHIKASCQHFQSWITADIIMEAGCRWMCLKASQELIDEFFYFWTWLVICHYQSHVCCTPPPPPCMAVRLRARLIRAIGQI